MSRVSPAFPDLELPGYLRTVDSRQMVDDIRRLQAGSQIAGRITDVEQGRRTALSRLQMGGEVTSNKTPSAGDQDVHTATLPTFKASWTQSSFRRRSTISAWFIRCVLCEVYSSANETPLGPQ